MLQQHKAAQLKVFHSMAQPEPQKSTVCQSVLPQCSHVCVVVRDQSPVCLCPRNSTKIDDRTCRVDRNYSEIQDPVGNRGLEEEEVSERFMSTLIIIITASSIGILIILLTLLVSLPLFFSDDYIIYISILSDSLLFEKKEIQSRR